MRFRWRLLGLKPFSLIVALAVDHVKGNFWQLQLLLRGTGPGAQRRLRNCPFADVLSGATWLLLDVYMTNHHDIVIFLWSQVQNI